MMKLRSLPFAVLGFSHLALLAFTYIKKRDRRIVPLFLVNVGFAYILEYIIFNLFQSYRYKPAIIRNKHVDNVFGALVSQSIAIPAAATFLSAFGAGGAGKALYTLLFIVIEKLFITFELFQNYWWKTRYTLLLVPVGFLLSDRWYALAASRSRIIRSFVLFMSGWVTQINFLFLFALMRQPFRFRIHVSRQPDRDHFIAAPLYALWSACLITLARIRSSRPALVFALLCLHMTDLLLYSFKVLRTQLWSVYLLLPVHALTIFITGYIDSLVGKSHEEEKGEPSELG